MPPEAEENGAHAQGREENCSLKRMRCAVAQNQRTRANVDCGRRMYCVVYGTRGKNKEKNK